MKRIAVVTLVLVSLTLGAASARAASITYDVRSIDNYSFPSPTYLAGWAAQSTPIASQSLSDFNGSVGSNYGYDRLTVGFTVSAAHAGSSVSFQLAPDAGYGGEVYLDGILLDQNTNDLWWGYDWANTSELLIGNSGPLAQGSYVLQAFWAEGCCNGSQGGRFRLNDQDWESLTVANLNALAVPEPGSIAIFGLGLAGLIAVRRKRVRG